MIAAKHKKSIVIESSAFGLEQLQAAVNRYCLSLTGSRWDAEDLAQETWMKAMGTLYGPGHANTEAFLLRIAKNTWIDHSRRKNLLSHILQGEAPTVTPADQGTLEIEMAFKALMKHLSPLQRTVFLLRDVFGYSSAESAEMLRTTEGAVKAALHRARQSLNVVKEDLETGILSEPSDEGLKAVLHALASAYQSGDIGRLVQLAQQDVVEPSAAISIVQTRLQRIRHSGSRPDDGTTALMAA